MSSDTAFIFFIGFIICAIAIGNIISAAVGWFVFGAGIIFIALLDYLNGGEPRGKY